MNTFKKLLFPLFSLFLAFRTVELLGKLISSKPGDLSNSEVLVVAFLLSLFITGTFAFLGFAYSTSSIISDDYYKIKKPKTLSSAYELLGVKYFRVLLLLVFWARKKNRRKYFDGTKKGLRNFIYQTKQSEFGHLAAFIAIFLCSVFLLMNGFVFLSIVMTLINVLGNVYPVLLQRFHRMRIERIIK